MLRHGLEVLVRGQEEQAVTNGQSSDQGVDRADLHSVPPTVVAKRRRLDVIFNLGHDDRQEGELSDDCRALRRSAESLEQLLKN